jgi:uncharacterized protein (DUF697 family)
MARLVLVDDEEKIPSARLVLAEPDVPKKTSYSEPITSAATWLAKRAISTSDLPLESLKNVPESTARLVGGVVESVMHPINTMEGINQLAQAGWSKVLPESILQYADVEKVKRAKETASNVGEFYKQRYGGTENIKHTLAQDPIGSLADISTLLGGGAGLAKMAGAPLKATQALSTASKYTNPLLPVEKAVSGLTRGAGEIIAQGQGGFTGTGATPIKEAYSAGKYSKPAFWANLTGKEDISNVVDTAKQGVLSLKIDKNNQYRSGMLDIGKDKAVLSFNDIDTAVQNAFGNTKFKDQVTKEAAFKKVSEAQDVIDKWKNLDPAEYHTPEGMDALKQKIGDIVESVPYEQASVRNALNGIYSSTWKTISNQAPTYGKVMKDYEEATTLIKDIEKGLSLGKKASSDTSLRKLQSVMRNNVQTNYGERINMVKQLEKAGGKEIMPSLAGQSLNEWLPRGMVGQIERAGGIYGMLVNPLLTAVGATVASPKVTGTVAYGLGKIAGLKDKILRGIPLTAEEANQAALMNYQVQNATGLLGK